MPNNDYILRGDALKAILGVSIYDTIEELEGARTIAENTWADGLWDAYKIIEEEVDAADVEGNRMTGVWLEQDEMPNVSSNKIYRCSVCNYADEQSPSAEVPFCWHCGSKMKKMFRGGGE